MKVMEPSSSTYAFHTTFTKLKWDEECGEGGERRLDGVKNVGETGSLFYERIPLKEERNKKEARIEMTFSSIPYDKKCGRS